MALANVDWVAGDHAHMPALQKFICAAPPKSAYHPQRGHHHPAPWALDVQSWLRGLTLPPRSQGEGALLAITGNGSVAAACHFGFDSSWEQFIVFAIATSVDHQRRGLATSALALTRVILDQNRERLELDCGVFTRIHRKNDASKELFRRAGFEFLQLEGDYEAWVGSTA